MGGLLEQMRRLDVTSSDGKHHLKNELGARETVLTIMIG